MPTLTTEELTPEEYILKALSPLPLPAASAIRVHGNVSLADPKSLIHELPEAQVTGSLRVENCPHLQRLKLEVSGMLTATGCSALQSLSGSASSVEIDGSPLASVGADFVCWGDMRIKNAASVIRMNCHIGGHLSVSGPALLILGPAFACLGTPRLTSGAHCASQPRFL